LAATQELIFGSGLIVNKESFFRQTVPAMSTGEGGFSALAQGGTRLLTPDNSWKMRLIKNPCGELAFGP
jgi:hypothetical protein